LLSLTETLLTLLPDVRSFIYLPRQDESMTECVAVLLGTVQFHLKVKVVVPENATLRDTEEAALAAIEDDPIKNWTLVEERASFLLWPPMVEKIPQYYRHR
jgi:hypothetical protein